MIVVDTSALIALSDPNDAARPAVRGFLLASKEELRISPFVVAEADYMLSSRFGQSVELALLEDVSAGNFGLDRIDEDDISRCAEIIRRYEDLHIGLTDASNVVLAHRHRTRKILTLDTRHFRALRTLKGEAFVLLPADA